MAQDQKVTLTFKMSDDTEKQVEFTVPGGKDGLLQELPLPSKKNTEIVLGDVDTIISHAVTAIVFELGIQEYPVTGSSTSLRITTFPTKNGAYVLTNGPSSPNGAVRTQVWSIVGSLFTRISEQIVTDHVLTRGTGGGNFSFGYPDNKSANNACGKMGTGVYWKVTISLDNAGAGNVAVIPKVWTNNIPCMEDGTLVPYQFVVDYVESRNNAIPTAAVWLICMGVPTHTMDVTSGTLTKLQMSAGATTSGLTGVYPVAPTGEYAQEPQWRREYFYDDFKA